MFKCGFVRSNFSLAMALQNLFALLMEMH
jgi:hypothetical protein